MRWLISFSLLFANVAACQPQYVTTIHPLKVVIQEIVGERGEVHGILPPGASPHTYELRPSDAKIIETARAIFYGADNLDGWVLKFPNANQIELITLVAPSALIYFDESKSEPPTAAHHEHPTETGHDHSSGVDPHFWTDPLTVKSLLPGLVQQLSGLDPSGTVVFKQNAERFSRQLDSLHHQLHAMLAPVAGSKVMISHPFFQYFFKRYNIHLVGIVEAIPGKEPTPRQLKGYIEQVKQQKVKAIFDHLQLPDRAAKLVAEAAGIKICQLDPLGGVAGRQSYDELLLYNARLILEALR